MEEINWEELARKYQLENEDLRLGLYSARNRSYRVEIDFESLSKFVEKNYILIICTTIVLSYIGSFLIDLYKARSEISNGRK